LPNASEPRRSDNSCIRDFVSFGEVLAERSSESFAMRQGWLLTVTFAGKDMLCCVVGLRVGLLGWIGIVVIGLFEIQETEVV